MEISNRLTPDEIEALQRDKKESLEYYQKLFRDMEQDTSAKPYHLTSAEIDALRAEMKASSEWMEQELNRLYPNRTRTHKG